MKVIDSPCVRNCCLDQNDTCLGCFRTLKEITQWSQVDNNGKEKILGLARMRRERAMANYPPGLKNF
ncbi:MAG: DUF1289 domain-containing protein [Methylobacter sp.]|nr:MAG: DUF1289 domain-containing protein [Methylobacter sp.]PPD04631.1 MAG: DUF1289 domain-containing protein [Methylobacter sp.]PPD17851.1 MAG: DUF1289 domain-containing protein [Methylobacter sp.]PPD37460.1 MAG: DUF1289 domain-containing protein [Methylomonas sp.]